MGRFDVYATPGQGGIGYVLDVQGDLLRDLTTRVIVPCTRHRLRPSQLEV